MNFKKPSKGAVFTFVFFSLMLTGLGMAWRDDMAATKASDAIRFKEEKAIKGLNREQIAADTNAAPVAVIVEQGSTVNTSVAVVSNRARFKKGVWETSQWRDSFSKIDMGIKCLYSDKQIDNNVAGEAMPLEEREMLCIRQSKGGVFDVFVRLPKNIMTEYTGVGKGNFRFDYRDGTDEFKTYYVGRNANWDYPGAIVMQQGENDKEELAARIERSKSIAFKVMLIDGSTPTISFSNHTGNRLLEKVPYE